MKAAIHQIKWNGNKYYKVYAENLNGRMTLITKTKFPTADAAKKYAQIMLPSHKLDTKVKEVKY